MPTWLHIFIIALKPRRPKFKAYVQCTTYIHNIFTHLLSQPPTLCVTNDKDKHELEIYFVLEFDLTDSLEFTVRHFTPAGSSAFELRFVIPFLFNIFVFSFLLFYSYNFLFLFFYSLLVFVRIRSCGIRQNH